jgi:hypothetical protein
MSSSNFFESLKYNYKLNINHNHFKQILIKISKLLGWRPFI